MNQAMMIIVWVVELGKTGGNKSREFLYFLWEYAGLSYRLTLVVTKPVSEEGESLFDSDWIST